MITERHVLTAAHCAINDDLVSVRLGEHQIGNDTDGANPIGMFNWLTLNQTWACALTQNQLTKS